MKQDIFSEVIFLNESLLHSPLLDFIKKEKRREIKERKSR